jgi:hypothetical protein
MCGEDADTTFVIETISQKYKIEALPRGCIVIDNAGLWVNFAILRCVTEYTSDDGTLMTEASCVFYGEGPSGNLRECRHTYWGEDDNGGYIFYPYGPLIVAAFKRLSDFFDDMT